RSKGKCGNRQWPSAETTPNRFSIAPSLDDKTTARRPFRKLYDGKSQVRREFGPRVSRGQAAADQHCARIKGRDRPRRLNEIGAYPGRCRQAACQATIDVHQRALSV